MATIALFAKRNADLSYLCRVSNFDNCVAYYLLISGQFLCENKNQTNKNKNKT